MKITLGIDPGVSGALVILEDDQPIEWMEMPTIKVGTATRVHAPEITHFMEYGKHIDHVFVEAVHAMPGQGVTSMFNFGHSVGTIMGVIGALGYPCTMVTPQKWKKAAGLIGTDKDAARARAMQLWPTWRDLDKKGKGQAYADAALIARFGA
jgi:crossover junction endodeoxyribonuclease RuvC